MLTHTVPTAYMLLPKPFSG